MIGTTFMIEGEVPSKKNSRRVFARHGRVINIPSKRYQAWHDQALEQLEGFGSLNPPYHITLTFWVSTNRRTDLDNKVVSVLDLLQDAKIIEDDRWQVLPQIKAYAMGIDKDTPRVKVEILSEVEK